MGTATMMMPIRELTPCAATLERRIIGFSLPWLPNDSISSIQEAEEEAMGHHQSSTPTDGNQERDTIRMKAEADALNRHIGPIFIASLPNWKFYQNPFYHHNHLREQEPETFHDQKTTAMDVAASEDATRFYQRQIKALEDQQARTLSLVLSLRSELDLSRTRIAEMRSAAKALQNELETECRAKRRLQGINRSLNKALEKERAGREVVEGVCDELAREIGKDRAEVEDMRRECERVREEVEEERRMLRVAEVWREECVQMKLAEARRFVEQKISHPGPAGSREKKAELAEPILVVAASTNGGGGGDGGLMGWNKQQQTGNPHITRGIKGFVEFPRVVRDSVPKGRRVVGATKADCQKALLRQYILKQRVPVGFSNSSPENLVMG